LILDSDQDVIYTSSIGLSTEINAKISFFLKKKSFPEAAARSGECESPARRRETKFQMPLEYAGISYILL